MDKAYSTDEPTRTEVDQTRGALVLEFGDNFCGFCRRAQPAIAQALGTLPGVPHRKIADGRGRPLGRSFGVKLWPTLIVLHDGQEKARVVRPESADSVAQALAALPTQA